MEKSNLPDIISQKADDLLEKAEEEDLVHGLLSLLPAGGFLDKFLFRRIRKRARQRLEEFHIKFAEQLSKLNDLKVDKDFLESEEFDILVMKIVSKTVWEHSEEKRTYLRNILLNCITVDFSKNPLKETLIELITDLSPAHIKVLDAFAQKIVPSSSGFRVPSDAHKVIDGLSELDAQAIGDDLSNKSLLLRDKEYPNTMEISGLGKSLLAFLKEPVN